MKLRRIYAQLYLGYIILSLPMNFADIDVCATIKDTIYGTFINNCNWAAVGGEAWKFVERACVLSGKVGCGRYVCCNALYDVLYRQPLSMILILYRYN